MSVVSEHQQCIIQDLKQRIRKTEELHWNTHFHSCKMFIICVCTRSYQEVWQCRSSGGWSPASHRRGPVSRQCPSVVDKVAVRQVFLRVL
jgi:hypothetical protein